VPVTLLSRRLLSYTLKPHLQVWRILRVNLCCVRQEAEPFLAQCHACGRRLVAIMSELRSTEGQSQVTRRQLHHQHRVLTRALTDPDLQRLRREGNETLTRLEERAQWLPASEDVRSVQPCPPVCVLRARVRTVLIKVS
jgi:hypothetical protein